MPPRKKGAPSEDLPEAPPIDNTTFAATKMVAAMAGVVEGRGPQERAVAAVRECQKTGATVASVLDRSATVEVPPEIIEDLMRVVTNYPR